MTLSFHHQNPEITNSIGKVALSLTRLLDAGYPIPKGFIVSSQTCQAFFTHGRLKDKINLLLERCDFHNPDECARVSKNIKKLIMAAEIPSEISDPLLAACVKLGRGKAMLTASPIADSVSSDRIYGLIGEAAILMSIRELWASQFPASELYRIQAGEFPLMAISVQTQPDSQVSGILVTTTVDKTACKIQAVWGEGAFVGKLQGADSYLISRSTGEERNKERSLQTKEIIFSHGKLETYEVPASRQKKQKLPDSALKELSRLAEKIQRDKFFSQELTFAFDGKKIFLLDLHDHVENEVAVIPQPSDRRILLKGLGLTPGIITGMVRIVRPDNPNVGTGDILVTSKLSHLSPEILRTAKGIIAEETSPSHTAIQLANKGVAIMVSAAGAVDLLEPGTFVTLHTQRGEVLAGGYRSITPTSTQPVNLATRLGTKHYLGKSFSAHSGLRGHLILSPNKLIETIGVHPAKLIKEKKTKTITQAIKNELSDVIAKYPTEPLIYEFSHLTSSQYRQLSGGQLFEGSAETNPLMGFYGSSRLLSLPQHLSLEIEAIEQIRRESTDRRLSLMLPKVRTAFEVQQWHRILNERLPRSASLRYFVDLSFPGMCWQLDRVAGLVDGVILNIDQLIQHLFAITPEASNHKYQPLDFEPSVTQVLNLVTKITREQGIYLILSGRSLSYDPYLSFAVQNGIHELNLPESELLSARQRLEVLEQERVNV